MEMGSNGFKRIQHGKKLAAEAMNKWNQLGRRLHRVTSRSHTDTSFASIYSSPDAVQRYAKPERHRDRSRACIHSGRGWLHHYRPHCWLNNSGWSHRGHRRTGCDLPGDNASTTKQLQNLGVEKCTVSDRITHLYSFESGQSDSRRLFIILWHLA